MAKKTPLDWHPPTPTDHVRHVAPHILGFAKDMGSVRLDTKTLDALTEEDDDLETIMGDMLADIKHFMHFHKLDAGAIEEKAEEVFQAELEEAMMEDLS